jgi:zinc transporter
VALVFLPLTFLTGLLGMNVEGIPFADAPWAFWGVVSVCVAAAALIAGYFVRAHWFRG